MCPASVPYRYQVISVNKHDDAINILCRYKCWMLCTNILTPVSNVDLSSFCTELLQKHTHRNKFLTAIILAPQL